MVDVLMLLVLAGAWTIAWVLILKHALRRLLRQRLLERVLLDRIEKLERGAASDAIAVPTAASDAG